MSDFPTVIILCARQDFEPANFVMRHYSHKSLAQAVDHNSRLAGEHLNKMATALYANAPGEQDDFKHKIMAAYSNCAILQQVVYDSSLIVHATSPFHDTSLLGAKYKHHEVRLADYTVSLNTLEICADLFDLHGILKKQTLRAVADFFDKSRHDLLHASLGEFEFTHPESVIDLLRLSVANFDYAKPGVPYLPVCMEYNLRNAVRAFWLDEDSQNEIAADMNNIFFSLDQDLAELAEQGHSMAYRYARNVIGLTIQTLGYLTVTDCPVSKYDFSTVQNWSKLDKCIQEIAQKYSAQWPEFSELLSPAGNKRLFRSILAATDFMPGDEDAPAITPRTDGAKAFILQRLNKLGSSSAYVLAQNPEPGRGLQLATL